MKFSIAFLAVLVLIASVATFASAQWGYRGGYGRGYGGGYGRGYGGYRGGYGKVSTFKHLQI